MIEDTLYEKACKIVWKLRFAFYMMTIGEDISFNLAYNCSEYWYGERDFYSPREAVYEEFSNWDAI